MIIKNITVRNLGSISYFSFNFAEGINTIKNRATDELSYAIEKILNCKSVSYLPMRQVSKDTEITATVCIEEKLYRILIEFSAEQEKLILLAKNEQGEDVTEEYLYLSTHCEAQDFSEVFDGSEKIYHLSLLRYINSEYLYSSNDLSEKTNGYLNLNVFRAYLLKFLKNFNPEKIRAGKRYELILKENKVYDVRYSNDENMDVYLSDCEQMIFNYLCFLNTAEFWRGFEEIRNLHSIKKPLLIMNFFERIDESLDTQSILKRTKNLKRQIIILSI